MSEAAKKVMEGLAKAFNGLSQPNEARADEPKEAACPHCGAPQGETLGERISYPGNKKK